MCSISGLFTLAASSAGRPSMRIAVEKMNAAMRHRGPDDSGVAEIEVTRSESAGLVLGNTRLAIIDTSIAGHQPMRDTLTGNFITYNGEAYNFRELRNELGPAVPWISTTDTEVILRAYAKWGLDSLRKLRGMFALAIWDNHAQQLVLTRDQFGIKPLYYTIVNDRQTGARHFLFASEVRALLASGLVARKLSSAGVTSFLGSGSTTTPATIIEGVKSLCPGECLIVRDNGRGDFVLTAAQTTSYQSAIVDAVIDRNDAVRAVRDQLEASVRSHLVSDVPVGVFLSGGMDSSALVALLSQVGDQRPRTFTIVFSETKYNEERHANFVAEKFKTEHSDILITDDELLKSLPDALNSIDQPTMDGMNTFVVSREVKNAGVTVALSGLGGDELFAGYPSFSRGLQVQGLSNVARKLLKATAGVGKLALSKSVKGRKLVQLAASELTPADVYGVSRQLFSDAETSSIRSQSIIAAYADQTACALAPGEVASKTANGEQDWINCISQLELSGYMTNTLLRDTDSTSMASSLEVRVPFIDADVANLVLSLPGKWKVDGSRPNLPKPLLADAVSELLPPSFLSRPKMGFTMPFERWLPGRLKNELADTLTDRSRLTSAGLDPDSASRIWRRFTQSSASVGWSRPWSLYVLVKWCELNHVTV